MRIKIMKSSLKYLMDSGNGRWQKPDVNNFIERIMIKRGGEIAISKKMTLK